MTDSKLSRPQLSLLSLPQGGHLPSEVLCELVESASL